MRNFKFLSIAVLLCFPVFGQKENEELFFEQKVIVHPNPATESFKLVTEDETSKTVIVRDCNGKVIFQATSSDKNLDVFCNDWLTGTYFISLFQESGNSTYKIVKQ